MNERNLTAIKMLDGWTVFTNETVRGLAINIDKIHSKGETMITVHDVSGSPVALNIRNIVRLYIQNDENIA